jgi:hypothetical protein
MMQKENKMMQKKYLYITLSVLIVLFVVASILYLVPDDNKKETPRTIKSNVQQDANLDRKSDRSVAPEPDTKPSASSEVSSVRTCKDINASTIESLIGNGYTTKNIDGDAKMPSDFHLCEYSKSDKRVTITVYDYGVERLAEAGKKSLGTESTVVGRQGSKVVAVSYWQGGSYRKELSQKALDEIIKSL